MIAYLIGIIGVAFVPELSWAWWGMLLTLLLACFRPIRNRALLLAGGILVASLYGHWQLAHRFEQPPRDLTLTAEVVALPSYRDGRYTLLLKPLVVDSSVTDLPPIRRIKASVYDTEHTFALGDQLQLVVRLKPPVGLSNPAAFDLERHYLSQGIDARGYIRQVIERQAAAPSMRHARQHLANHFDHSFNTTGSATLRAVVLGDRSQLTPEQWDVLRVTGTAHLFVVSGLHVAVIAALGWWIGRLLQLPALLLRWQWVGWRLLAPVSALTVAGGYAWLSGWGIPVQRAWLMLAVFMAGSWLLRPLTGWQRWRLALLVIVSLHPLSVLEAGLWLSFGAVALILWMWQCGAKKDGPGRWLNLGFRLQLVLFVGMLPLMAVIFNQLSLLSIPVNLVAVPVLTVLIWSLPVLLALCGFHAGVAVFVDQALAGIWRLLAWCAEVPGLHAEVNLPPGLVFGLIGLAVALLLLPMPSLFRLLVLPMLAPVLSDSDRLPSRGSFSAWVFDVGQGQAVLIETSEGALLYDTGPGYATGGSAFPFAVTPWLERQGIRHLNVLVVSHGDSDHAGGYQALRKQLTLGRVYAGEPELLVGAVQCSQQQWQLGGVQFSFQQAFKPQQVRSSNNRSCVLRIENDHCSLLLTGDLDASGEYRLLSGGHREPVTWLIAGHHGSRDSTTGALLDWLQPERVLISAGRYNRFGHPHAEVVSRVHARGIPWMQTAEVGAIKLVADPEQCSAEGYREQKKRYWTAS